MIGQTISHYKVVEKLGEGGMGVVYKAHDTKLDRLVALKFLPQQITRQTDVGQAVSEENIARFLQEAKAISALNHPGIATIYDVDEAEGPACADAPAGRQKFLVLEYIPGGTLKSKLKHLKSEDQEFSLVEVLDYGIQAAEALAHAHRHQIIHRDVKTDNLMLTEEGKIKLTDFGLAKLRGSAQVTKTGTAVGTAAYMSPEQIRGEEVDQRSDIFSLGVVLYELISSRLPFRGEFETALSYSILNENPPPVKSLRKDAPPALEKIIDRCLEKEKTKRYQTAEEVVDALREVRQEISPAIKVQKNAMKVSLLVGSAIVVVAVIVIAYFFWPQKPTPSVAKSIAVLPFVDMSPQKDQEYFCDGMTEELINRLSNTRELKVVARTSVFVFKGKEKDIREIGEKLNVQTVLEGSVRKDSSKLRITAQLINVADNYHIWSQTYDRELKDVFAIQDEISLAIVNALKVNLTSEENRKLSEKPIDNVAAFDYYLRASHEMSWSYQKDAIDRAVQNLQKAIDIIGDNALLYTGLARAYYLYVDLGIKPEEYVSKADEYAKKAMSLDPHLPQVLSLMGTINRDVRGNPREAIRYYRMAIAANPNESGALRGMALCYVLIGKPSISHELMEQHKRVDPLSVWTSRIEAHISFFEGQFGKALEKYVQLFHSDSQNSAIRWFYTLGLIYNNRFDEALSTIDATVEANPSDWGTRLALLYKHALMKEEKKAYQLMTPEFSRTCKLDPSYSWDVAVAFALLGKRKDALDWLENAVDRGFINYPFLAEKDPFLANLRGEERFKKLMERAKKEWEDFEV